MNTIKYGTLEKLQVVLSEIFVIEDKIKEIPSNLRDKEAVLQKTKMDYLEMHRKYDSIKFDVDVLFEKYKNIGKEREEKERQIAVSTISRECENLLKEIEEDKASEQTLLKSYNAKNKYLSELEVKLKSTEEILDIQEQEVEEESKKMDKLISEQNALLKDKQIKRDKLSAHLPQDLLFKFERIIRNKGGVGVVPIHGIICQGCHMELPQQFANDVRKNEAVHFCPYCSRVLYYEESEEDLVVDTHVHGDVHNDEEIGAEVNKDDFISGDENLFED